MTDNDIRQRFLFPHSDIRGEIVRLEASVSQALAGHDYPMVIQGLLGEALAAVSLLAGTLKFEGRLSLQAQGQGVLTLLLAESTHDSAVRALARAEVPGDSTETSLPALLGDGLMAITIRPEQGTQYQGLVPMERNDLAGCLEDYFAQSEQLPTRLWLAAGNGHAAGLLLQRLPNRVADAALNEQMWQHLTTLADTLGMEELLDLPVETVLHRLFHETPPALSPAAPIRFGCTCSREKVAQTLASLGATEIQAILTEQGEARVSCDFCGTEEVFDAVDLGALLHELGARPH